MIIDQCECGYTGEYRGMAFEVDEAYNELNVMGEVFTVRAGKSGKGYDGPKNVHVHRNHVFTGIIGTRYSVRSGSGENSLFIAMQDYFLKSGFKSSDEWMRKVKMVHGHVPPDWVIYRVVAKRY